MYLDIRRAYSNEEGWHNVSGSGGQNYSYHYSGGNDATYKGSHGHVKYKADNHAKTIEVTFQPYTDTAFEFDKTFFDPVDSQLQWTGTEKRKRTIKNNCTSVTHAKYNITIIDKGTKQTLDCDPSIKNEPV
ncbi:MAG: hypothetical protein ABI247_11265 [Rhodanobacter sp.]